MKYFYSLIFVFSASISAQEYEPKYELEANKAEYYIGTFNKGKDIDDLVSWYEKFAKWTSTTDGTYNNMTVGLLQPYFHSALMPLSDIEDVYMRRIKSTPSARTTPASGKIIFLPTVSPCEAAYDAKSLYES